MIIQRKFYTYSKEIYAMIPQQYCLTEANLMGCSHIDKVVVMEGQNKVSVVKH